MDESVPRSGDMRLTHSSNGERKKVQVEEVVFGQPPQESR